MPTKPEIAQAASPQLRRSMGFFHATAMVVGIIVGASIFVQPSEIARLVSGTREVLLVWVAAGALTLCGVLVCAELASVFPETGGVYVYLKRTFSPGLGFLWGWAMFWSMHSGIVAAIAVILARYVAYFVPLGETGIRAVAIGAILLLSGVNYLGVRPGSALQVAVTAAKVAAIAAMVGLLFWFGAPAHHAIAAAEVVAGPARPASLAAYGLAIAAGLFAFGGWHMVTYAAGETRDPRRTIPMALVAGTVIVTICYLLLNAGYLYVLPAGELAQSARVAADATRSAVGAGAGGAIAALVALSAVGALNGVILAGPRVYYAMARDGVAFGWLGAVHRRYRTPYLAIAAQAVWSCVLVAANTYRQLFTRVIYTEWLFFALLAAGLFVLRRRREYHPAFLARGYPVVPALFILASLGIAFDQVAADLRGSAVGLGLVLVGLPVYFAWTRGKAGGKPESHR